MAIYPPNNIAPKKGLNYVWNYLGSSLKTLANALSPYLGGGDTGVKRYKALLNQSGTDAPVATILENSLGGTPVWTRSNKGEYYCTLNGVFTENKTICFYTHDSLNGSTAVGGSAWVSIDQVSVYFTGFDGLGKDIDSSYDSIEIIVYP